MSDFNMNNQYAPQQPQYGAPVAPAAPAKKPFPTKIIAIAVAAIVAFVAIFAIFGGVSGDVKKEVKDYYDDAYGIKVGSLKKEYKQSKDGAKMYVISGRINGSTLDEDDEDYDEDIEDYKGGYFICVAYEYDGDVEVSNIGIFEKGDKDDFKEELEEGLDEIKDSKDEIDEILEAIVEAEED